MSISLDLKWVGAVLALAGAASAVATGYVRLKDVVPKAEAMDRRLAALEVKNAVDDARWNEVKDRLSRIERKLDRERPR